MRAASPTTTDFARCVRKNCRIVGRGLCMHDYTKARDAGILENFPKAARRMRSGTIPLCIYVTEEMYARLEERGGALGARTGRNMTVLCVELLEEAMDASALGQLRRAERPR